MWDLKKNPPETMDVAFLFWNHKKIGQHLLPLKVPHRKIEFGIVFMFLYLFIHSLIHIFEKIGQHLLPLKVRHRNIELWIDLFKCIFDCYFFLNLIHKTQADISVLKSFNNSPACIYFHSKCLTARLSFELYLCFFIYSFIHSFTYSYFFYYYLFVSLYLIYINQVWHFCFEIVQ